MQGWTQTIYKVWTDENDMREWSKANITIMPSGPQVGARLGLHAKRSPFEPLQIMVFAKQRLSATVYITLMTRAGLGPESACLRWNMVQLCFVRNIQHISCRKHIRKHVQVAPSQFSMYLSGCRFTHEEVLLKVDSECEAVRDSWHVKSGTCHSESWLKKLKKGAGCRALS